MNPRRLHARLSFFKYVSAPTCLAILRHKRLRWSAPKLFNDPFDVPETICDGIDDVALHNAAVDAMNRLIRNPDLPHPEHHNMMTRALIAGMRRADEKMKEEMIRGNEEHRRTHPVDGGGLRELRAFWKEQYPAHRILCMTEKWDSASMWDRYAGGHGGAVLEFTCSDEHDSAWLMAKPVKYSNAPLKTNTANGLAELLFYTPEYAVGKLLEEYTHTKTTDWEYEQEWRMASWKRPNEEGHHTDYLFLPEELKSVILGARMSDADEEAVRAEIANGYGHVEMWQSAIEGGRQVKRSLAK